MSRRIFFALHRLMIRQQHVYDKVRARAQAQTSQGQDKLRVKGKQIRDYGYER
jgi:hypothetical protein